MAIIDSPGGAGVFERIARHDRPFLESLLGMRLDSPEASGLDPRTHALVRIAALVSTGAAPASFVSEIGSALERGATADEVVGVFVALAPIVGASRIVACAPEVALALGVNPPLDEE